MVWVAKQVVAIRVLHDSALQHIECRRLLHRFERIWRAQVWRATGCGGRRGCTSGRWQDRRAWRACRRKRLGAGHAAGAWWRIELMFFVHKLHFEHVRPVSVVQIMVVCTTEQVRCVLCM